MFIFTEEVFKNGWAVGEQEETKFLQTDCFIIRNYVLSGKAHWIQIMSRRDIILLCYAVCLESTMEKIGEGIIKMAVWCPLQVSRE